MIGKLLEVTLILPRPGQALNICFLNEKKKASINEGMMMR